MFRPLSPKVPLEKSPNPEWLIQTVSSAEKRSCWRPEIVVQTVTKQSSPLHIEECFNFVLSLCFSYHKDTPKATRPSGLLPRSFIALLFLAEMDSISTTSAVLRPWSETSFKLGLTKWRSRDGPPKPTAMDAT